MFATERDLPVALWIDTPALGDTIAAIPTLRKLSKAFEDKPLTVFTSNPSLFDGHPLVYQALHSDEPKDGYKVYHTFWPLVGKTYDLSGSKVEFRHSNMDIRQFHATSLGFSLLPEEMDTDLYCESMLDFDIQDYVIIHPTHTWPTRTWEQAKWQELVDRLNAKGIPVVAVGKDSAEVGTFNVQKPVMQIEIKLGLNLLNDPRTNIPALRWMMQHKARAVVTMDSGILHVAGTTDVNIIQLGSSIDPKLRAPWRKGSQDYKYQYIAGGCEIFCSSNMRYNSRVHGSIHGVPPQIHCLEDKPTFECQPTVDQVYDAVVDLYDVRPNIRIVHLLLEDDLTQERQTKSIQSISALKDHGIDYVQVWNKRWTETPPRETFAQPERYNEIPIKPGHYGNFRAFADATLEYFTEDLDALIYVEGDAIITTELQDLIDSINQAYQATQEHEIALFSFGSRHHLEIDSLESQTLKQLGNIHIVNKFVGAQFVMIPKQMRNFVKDRFVYHVWSTADIFLSNIFTGKFDMAIFEKPYVIQADGVSAIDGNYKTHLAEEARLETVQKHARAYITHTTENYEHVIINLVKSIRAFSDVPVLVFTVDYEASDLLKSLAECHRVDVGLPDLTDDDFHDNQLGKNMYVNRNTYRTYMALSAKIDAMIVACSLVKEWVYLDGDCLANHNVDDLFDFIEGAEYPLATRGPYEYTMSTINGVMLGNPFDDNNPGEPDNTKTLEWPLMQHFNMHSDQRSSYYKTTNILVGSEQHVEFLTEWKHLRDTLPTQVDPIVHMPFHEETIYNVMVWARTNKGLPMVYINITGPEQVEHFFGYQGEEQMFSEFYLHPGNTEGIKVFHGEKRKEQADKIVQIIKDRMRKKRLLYIAPHLSTGGMPQFLQTRVEAMLNVDEYEIYVLEYNQYATDYVVQRNRIQSLLGDNFRTIGHLSSISDYDRAVKMQQIIQEINPDLIHIEESPEAFDSFNRVDPLILTWLYDKSHIWKIVETCHNIWFKAENKQYLPDGMMYCTPYHPVDNFKRVAGEIAGAVVPYPLFDHIPTGAQKLATKRHLGMDSNKIHVLNVGLWTSGKNQAEGVEIARIAEQQHPGKFQFHFVGNQASNFEQYWGPVMANLPTNVTVWGERGDTKAFMVACDAFMFNSTWECSPLALREAISHGMVTFSRNLPQYLDTFTPYIVPFSNDLTENASTLIQRLTEAEELFGTFTLPKDDFARFQQQHIQFYGHMLSRPRAQAVPASPADPEFIGHLEHIGNLRLVVDKLGSEGWSAEFLDGPDVIYRVQDLKAGHWYAPTRRWHTDWLVRILRNGKLHTELRWTLQGRECHIRFDTGSLGDTLSWVGQLVRFKKIHGLQKLLVYTPKNWLFDQEWYNEQGIEFVDKPIEGHKCTYTLGVYFDEQEPWRRWEHKYDWRTVTLGKIAADRLGIEYQEVRPRLASQFTHGSINVEKPYVVIATQSTAQAKYWNNPTGWQELTKWYNEQGLDVYHASKEGGAPAGAIQTPEDLGIVAAYIRGAMHFVGISSGLSWFAWALGKETILISGFTDPYVEFQDRVWYVNNHQVCHGCWGNRVFDRGDWNWCPDWKGTQRQFECSKKISSQQVIEVADKLLQAWHIEM
jgi:autotransporter strand-loop-strand O-heptosyltransferase